MSGGRWDKRIQRANELAAAHPFASQGLRFYERIAGFQKSLYGSLEAGHGHGALKPGKRAGPPGSLRDELELFTLLPWFASFLAFVEEIAPPPLAQAAAELRQKGTPYWEEVLAGFWRAGAGPAAGLTAPEALTAWAFLQPYAEHLAARSEPPAADGTPDLCPLCFGAPQVGVLRQQGDGAKRSLICSLCATEWGHRRIVCAACGEEGVDKLPVYVAEELAHVRVEACDTCRRYIKTIDLTKNGRAVPVVDELAAIPLSLWADEHGYSKVTPNLLGI